ncbi:hypothetical protein COV20_03370 [Candidatus Woesearchaeota archaeon CG10_big_fil_rev_8_21_14_0_10_45_16]|nr:MAG: hypothetical protein COV20_03370 [Candidatus Woesearchaeota archaeon CG10_big_fil_rev_8_21_14_0_10_45_16]
MERSDHGPLKEKERVLIMKQRQLFDSLAKSRVIKGKDAKRFQPLIKHEEEELKQVQRELKITREKIWGAENREKKYTTLRVGIALSFLISIMVLVSLVGEGGFGLHLTKEGQGYTSFFQKNVITGAAVAEQEISAQPQKEITVEPERKSIETIIDEQPEKQEKVSTTAIGQPGFFIQSDPPLLGANSNVSAYLFNDSNNNILIFNTTEANDYDNLPASGFFGGDVRWWEMGGFPDMAYIGSTSRFRKIFFNLTSEGFSDPNDEWFYYDGSGWTPFNPINETKYFQQTGINILNFTAGANWSTVSVAGLYGPYYWVRFTCTDGCQTLGVAQISITATECEEYISACKSSGWVPGRTYCLDTDIIGDDASCMVFDNSNITLDCQGNMIDGDGDSSGHGIDVTTHDNITIDHCLISDFNRGVYFSGSDDSVVRNSNLTLNVDAGIYITNSDNGTVFNNSIIDHEGTSANADGGIFINDQAQHWNISFNNFSSNYFGINFYGSAGLNSHNNVTSNRFEGSTRAIGFHSNSDDTVIKDNIFLDSTQYAVIFGTASANQNRFYNNQFNGSTTFDIFLNIAPGGLYQTFLNNFADGYEFFMCFNDTSFRSNNNRTEADKIFNIGSSIIYQCNNAIINNLTTAFHVSNSDDFGALLITESDNVIVNNSNFTSNLEGISVRTSNNATIKNSVFYLNGDAGIYVSTGDSGTIFGNTFVDQDGSSNNQDGGIFLEQLSDYWNITGNNFSSNYHGINLYGSGGVNTFNNITANYFDGNTRGVAFNSQGRRNIIQDNIFRGQTQYAVIFNSASELYDEFYNNQFNGSTTFDVFLSSIALKHNFRNNFADGYEFFMCYNESYFVSSNNMTLVDRVFSLGSSILAECPYATIDNLTVMNHVSNSDDFGAFLITQSSNVTVTNSNFSSNLEGISVRSSDNVTIKNSKFSSNTDAGIYLNTADNGTIFNNTFVDQDGSFNNQDGGIFFEQLSDYWNISHNTFTSNYHGIMMYGSGGLNSGNKLTRNVINGSVYGLRFGSNSDLNFIFENTFRHSVISAILVGIGDDFNVFFRNNFESNAGATVVNTPADNYFNTTGTGNYWFHYDTAAEGCNDDNLDGFCDSPFNSTIQASFLSQDNFPYTSEIQFNKLPNITSVFINTTNPAANDTTTNITLHIQASDEEGDAFTNITDWRKNGTSIAVVNLRFEATDGNESSWTKDYGSKLNHGVVSGGASWSSTGGFDGYGAYDFDADSETITIPYQDSLNITGDLTISLWIKARPQSGNTRILQRGSLGYSLYLFGSTGSLYFGNNNGQIRTTATTFEDDTWHHVVALHNGTSGTFADYDLIIDSVNVPTVNSGSYTAFSGSNSDIRIGSLGTIDYNGSLDELMIFNHSLSQEQILALYHNRTDLIVSQETATGDNWTVCVTANDRLQDSPETCSNQVLIIEATAGQTVPSITSVYVNATDFPNNTTNGNLTVYVQATDAEGDAFTNITDWRVNGTSIAVLNMPFEAMGGNEGESTKDYSSKSNNGTVTGAVWNQTGGYDGFGAYEFDDTADYITIPYTPSLNITQNLTISVWIKAQQQQGNSRVIFRGTLGYNLYLFGSTGSLYFGNNNGQIKTTATTFEDDTWHHVVAMKNGTSGSFADYDLIIDGVDVETTSSGSFVEFNGDGSDLSLGISSIAFNGSMDELKIFNRSLSIEQIMAIYNNRTETIVSQETLAGENWTACVTSNDRTSNSAEVCSNQLLVLGVAGNTAPPAPVLISPPDQNTTINRTPNFIWNNSVDTDGDNVTYHLIVDDNSAFNNPEINVSNLNASNFYNTTYANTTELAVDTTYFWKVRGFDGTDFGSFSSTFNFTVQSFLAVSVLQDTINFGTGLPNQTFNTTDGAPAPFRTENVGNIVSNVTITGTAYFTSVAFPSSYYVFKVRENESNAFNQTLSNITYINMPDASASPHVLNLNWYSFQNDFLTDINITVPPDESFGAKSSTVTFTIS